MPESSTRLFAILARAARVGVILRRGPSKRALLLKWHLGSDTLDAGQWLKGRIYERRCDVSPSGDVFLYFAAKHLPRTDWADWDGADLVYARGGKLFRVPKASFDSGRVTDPQIIFDLRALTFEERVAPREARSW